MIAFSLALVDVSRQPPNKQFAADGPNGIAAHGACVISRAHAPRLIRQRVAAELRR